MPGRVAAQQAPSVVPAPRPPRPAPCGAPGEPARSAAVPRRRRWRGGVRSGGQAASRPRRRAGRTGEPPVGDLLRSGSTSPVSSAGPGPCTGSGCSWVTPPEVRRVGDDRVAMLGPGRRGRSGSGRRVLHAPLHVHGGALWRGPSQLQLSTVAMARRAGWCAAGDCDAADLSRAMGISSAGCAARVNDTPRKPPGVDQVHRISGHESLSGDR